MSKIIQIQTAAMPYSAHRAGWVEITVLRDDGSVWSAALGPNATWWRVPPIPEASDAAECALEDKP